ncbi:unknown [Ruminococcus sp. CAG:563]|nr:unknown [Ruminococcus sp. CAG:563]
MDIKTTLEYIVMYPLGFGLFLTFTILMLLDGLF